MRLLNTLPATLLALATLLDPTLALRSEKVQLSKIQSLTLRKDLQTSHRRVSAIPQLKCIGGSARGHYEIDVMRCKNAGADYDDENIQWTCTASLPEEFKLGSTDVICEGYDYPEDPYILKGSCGVEYRLVLTEKGEEKFGKKKGGWFGGDDDDDVGGEKTTGDKVVGVVFWMIFIGVAAWIVYNVVKNWATGAPGAGVGGGNRPGWGGGGGGWGGGYGGNDDDPPPPYDWRSGQGGSYKQGYGGTNPQAWRPGFWSGALGGAAAGYAAGRTGGRNNQTSGSGWGRSTWDNGEGSSRSSSGSSSYSATRHESTGFGSTSRR